MKNYFKSSLILVIGIAVVQTSYATCGAITPTSRYEVVAESKGAEIKDKKTGLIWQRCSVGQVWSIDKCLGSATDYTWVNALKAAKQRDNGYRLPNIKELGSLVDEGCQNPAINTAIFPNTSSRLGYWSSSPVTNNKGYAWLVHFQSGTVSAHYDTGHVRLVRDPK